MRKLVLFLVSAASCFIACRSTQSSDPALDRLAQLVRPPLQISPGTAALRYLVSPDYMMDTFERYVVPRQVKIEHVDQRGAFLYASVAKSEGPLWTAMADSSTIEFGEWDPGYQFLRLGNAFLRDSSRVLFRIPFAAFEVDSTLVVSRKFERSEYRLSLSELRDFVSGAEVYNSPALIVVDSQAGTPIFMANHAAPVSPFGTPSLQKLVAQLVDSTDSPELQAQKLLDFVSAEIEYQGHGVYEIFMKSHEVLLSGRSDCSGKVVLYSSLLNQLEIPHLLVYVPEHICIALPGDFPLDNGMHFTMDSVRYTIAETTAEGFQIGESVLYAPTTEADIEFLQKPGATTKVFDYQRGDSLDFGVMYIEIEE